MLKKFARGALYVILFMIFLRACGVITFYDHEHDWQEATCTAPRICSSCKAEDGEPLGHDWSEATCAAPKTCARCGKTEGSRAEHTWIAATCTQPEHCAVCGKDRHWYSVSLGHDWQEATCTTPKTCARCGETEGEPQHHFVSYHCETTIAPTCQSEGEAMHTCLYCDATETKTLSTIDHKAGDWVIIQEATSSASGTRAKYCTMCGIEMLREEYSLPVSSSSGSGSNFSTYDNESQQNTSAKYVLNTSSKVFHRPSCRDVPKISPSNYSTTNRTRDDLVSSGWRACGHCSP